MIETSITIGTFENAKTINNLARQQDFDIDFSSGRYIIDAKSILGVLSLDISKPITVRCHTENADKFLRNLFEICATH